MPRSAWMGESGALANTQGYSTHLENPSAIQTLIQSCAATNDTFELTGNGIRAITYACYQAYAWKSEGLVSGRARMYHQYAAFSLSL